MIIRSLEIENFGRFSGRNFEFRRGMNLVTGPNEAGKSTLAEVIPAVLFGTMQVERFKPWGRPGCSARVVFEGAGRTVEVWRDLLTDDVRLVERDDLYQTLAGFEGRVPQRGKSATCREYRKLLEHLLGVADDDLFRATCFFGQKPAEWSGDELGRKLRELVSGRDETDFSDVLNTLLEEHFQLTRENPWGRDKQRDRELELLRQRIEAGKGKTPDTFSLDTEEDPAVLNERVRLLAAELEHDRSEYVKGVCYVDRLRQNLQQDVTPTASHGGNEAVAGEVNAAEAPETPVRDQLRARLAAAGLPADPPQELPVILDQAAAIRQELAEIQRPLSVLAQKEGKVVSPPWRIIVVGMFLLICVIAAGWLVPFQPGLLSAVCGVGAIGLGGWGANGSLRRRRTLQDLGQQRLKLEQVRSAALARQAELTERCLALGLPSTAIDLVRLQKAVDANRALLNEYWSALRAPEQDKPLAPTKASESAPAPPISPELADLEQRLADFSAKLKAKEGELARLKSAAADAVGRGPAASGAARQETLQQTYRDLQRKVAVLRTAVDLLVDGVEEFRQSHLVRLTFEAGRLFGLMTSGRYSHLRLDDEMRPEVRIDSRRWQPADRLSRGTLDALYLALRIALSKVRGDGRLLPLLLDDPFVHMDRQRLASTLKLLDVAAAGGQLIVLSHNEDLARRAARERWHVISLGADTAGITEKEEEHAGQLHLL
jgi:DNA repair exonuclease SbcCD ATPase subunit